MEHTISSITNKIIKIIKEYQPSYDYANEKDLRSIIPYSEEFLLFTIKLEKAFNISFYPALEYTILSSIDRLAEEIYNLSIK